MFKYTLVEKLGNIEVVMKEVYPKAEDPKNGHYWLTLNDPLDEHGPFISAYEALKDYTLTMKHAHRPRVMPIIQPPEIVTQIIQVDFAKKKRLS